MKYKNLVLIGTSHIAKQSLDEVKQAFDKEMPDIVALELDRKRLSALMQTKKDKVRIYNIKRIGLRGFFFSLIGAWAEKKLGEYVGVSPGSEMKVAIKLAKKNNVKIALIDQDIEITLKRFSQNLTWKEKWNFIVDIFKAVVLRKKEIEFDLTKVPSKSIIKKLIKKVKERYPNIYKVLVEERNKVLANNLSNLMENNSDKKILAIVGAGHEDDIMHLLKKTEITYSFTVSQN
jgi:pheromone shutdown-related protein TraB